MTFPLSHDELLDEPIGNIVDGWVLNTGELYLFVEVEPGKQQTITLKRIGKK